MKVKLVNVAEYDLKDGKTTEIPFETFMNLCGTAGVDQDPVLPNVRLFKSMKEFKNQTSDELYSIDQNEAIRVLPNGQFFVFLKERTFNKEKATKSTKNNATTNTEEN